MPFPSPGDPPDPGIEPGFPTLWADALPSEPPSEISKSRNDKYSMIQLIKVPKSSQIHKGRTVAAREVGNGKFNGFSRGG